MAEASVRSALSWIPIWGEFSIEQNDVTFHGYSFTPEVPPKGQGASAVDPKTAIEPPVVIEPRGGVGRIVSNQRLTDGKITVDITFDDIDVNTTAEVLIHDDPVGEELLTVGLGADGFLINVRHWTRTRGTEEFPQETGSTKRNMPHWTDLRSVGDRRMLKTGQNYHLEVTVQGSFVTVEVNGVEAGSGNLPFQLSGKQVGLFCQSMSNIRFSNFRVERKRPTAFVVMQFNPPEYEELFNDVIVPVCESMQLKPFRSSQTYHPGLVIADIQQQIREARLVIAEITPVNANVYYEVGYADAIGKPVILIADSKVDQLPFDVRPYRTIFYENTIGGKAKVERLLTEFLRSITAQRG